MAVPMIMEPSDGKQIKVTVPKHLPKIRLLTGAEVAGLKARFPGEWVKFEEWIEKAAAASEVRRQEPRRTEDAENQSSIFGELLVVWSAFRVREEKGERWKLLGEGFYACPELLKAALK